MANARQTINGKAFEYALLSEFYDRLKAVTSVNIIQNSSLAVAKGCFESSNPTDKDQYSLTASFAVNSLIDIEPRLSVSLDRDDILQLELVPDYKGQDGDVRDLLAIRSFQKWEIGISAKNNHRAMKHSRLSTKLDFGSKWLGIPCSSSYFDQIKPVFNNLSEIRSISKKNWSEIGNYHDSVYVPILDAFSKELKKLDKDNPGVVAAALITYLVGNKDFYKVIKGRNKVEIQAYNLNGTLNQSTLERKAKYKVPRLKLPSRLIEVIYKDDSKSTLLVTLSDGWQISFRIHNASSRVEASLKFDVNLVSAPHTLFSNTLSVE